MSDIEEPFPYLPQGRALNVRILYSGDGKAGFALPYREDLVGDPDTGVLAGGVVTTLLDHTCGQAVYAGIPRSTSIATLDLRIDYMRAAKPGHELVAEARCYKTSKSVAFVRATCHDGDISDPVATAQAAFMLNANAGRPAGDNAKKAGQ